MYKVYIYIYIYIYIHTHTHTHICMLVANVVYLYKLLIIEKIYYVVYGDSLYILNFSVNQKMF